MTHTKTQRWLDLLAVLVGRRLPVPVDELMERVPGYRDQWQEGTEKALAAVRRKFERDKDELRAMGIPIETRKHRAEGRGEGVGYVIPTRDFYLPYLQLVSSRDGGEPGHGSAHAVGRVFVREEDAHAAILALRAALSLPSFPFRPEARSALRKLTFDLDPILEAEPGAEEEAWPSIRILDRPGGADPVGALGTLLTALYDRRRLRFRYHSIGRDVVEEREADPWGLLFQWGAWYLAAGNPGDPSASARLFRVDRMQEVRIARSRPDGPDFQVPEAFDLQRYADRKPWELGRDPSSETEVVVRFLHPASLLARRNEWGEAVPEEEGAKEGATGKEGSLRRFRVHRMDPFLRWILSLAGEAEILSPPSAVEAQATMATKILALYGEDR